MFGWWSSPVQLLYTKSLAVADPTGVQSTIATTYAMCYFFFNFLYIGSQQ